MKKGLLLVSFLLLCETSLRAEEKLDLPTYFHSFWNIQESSYTSQEDSSPLFSSVELKGTTREENLDEMKLHITPFAWGERQKWKLLGKAEKDLALTTAKAADADHAREIWITVLALREAKAAIPILNSISETCDKTLLALQTNPELVVEKPDFYLDMIEERQVALEKLSTYQQTVKGLTRSLASTLGRESVVIDLDALIPVEGIYETVAQWQDDSENPELQRRVLAAQSAAIEGELYSIQTKRLVNFFDIGTSVNYDGKSQAFEMGIGIEIPAGRFPAKAHELQRKRLEKESEAQTARLEGQRDSALLKARILDAAGRQNSPDHLRFEATMLKAQDAIQQAYGGKNLFTLKSKLIAEKYQLKSWESETQLYTDFLELAYLMGKLDRQGRPMLTVQPLKK